MNLKCDHCTRTASGTEIELLDEGWARITLSGTRSAKQFHLTAPLEDLDFEIAYRPTHKTYTPPSEEELRYIAKISDEDKLIGQRRIAAHQRKYPDRSDKSMKSLVMKARNLGYCR